MKRTACGKDKTRMARHRKDGIGVAMSTAHATADGGSHYKVKSVRPVMIGRDMQARPLSSRPATRFPGTISYSTGS